MRVVIESCEHEDIEYDFQKEFIEELNKLYDERDPKYLGLHQEFDGYEVKLKSYYYIGYRWLNEQDEQYIHIAPKIYNNHQVDYLKMFLECLKDPIVNKRLDNTYKIFFNEKWIEVDSLQDEITPLLILQFLQAVKNIAQKGLKKGYVKVTENLTSKIKGKILVNQTIKQNHFRNRVDKTVCNYQIFTIDCLENQILKTALLQCSKNLYSFSNNDDIVKLMKYNISAFELVNSKEVFDSDFAKIKHSPFYKEYKEALRLAKMIFKRFGFTLNSSAKSKKTKIAPFYINMPELFERYVEVKLRKCYKDSLVPSYGLGDGYKTSIGELRPDFIVKNKNLIIDAKYKYWFEEEKNLRFKDDFQQLSLYGRVKRIKKDTATPENEEPKILFIYPKIGGETECEKYNEVNDFTHVYKLGIQIPLKKK